MALHQKESNNNMSDGLGWVNVPAHWWDLMAPPPAFNVIVVAAELASEGNSDMAASIVVDARQDPRWLGIAGVRTLAGLLAGHGAHERFNQLRADLIDRAAHQHGDDIDDRVTASLEAVSMAECYERQQMGRLAELTSGSPFGPRETATVAAQLVGGIVAIAAGDDTRPIFSALRDRFGITR
ncbi:hypothetical protein [Mycobacterium intracellulare]|uniref:hypothetical protein n=1 Tax=Mycobacterium intracellulare TaxID=1767 RepID=UPI00191697C5|nr:hypothetical protein [Mycobacterium intracellulare]